ncbi:AAA family ATPase [Pseudacidovorax intermedius]|uniref:Cobyrinic acid a,c-diamide synthase n=1 Tax=Pseudacidovorax intermedius TaxID=433924 RepID=A0A147GN84_9BURK|nr:AAA family ATPase [Pseudacidovorax intermedius]KTT15428.1 cobyrinic acid a,c-diamide synthase [Pseudacidovorax intermedius]
MASSPLPPPRPISLADIAAQAERAVAMMEQIRSAMLAPTARKEAPGFSLSQLAALLEMEKGSISHRLGKGDLPSGRLNPSGSRREFTLAEARQWVREYRKDRLRPEGGEAITISIGNFKGGVSKTTTAVTLAQGLSLLGHRVLVIDTDPQGSLTTLFGILPDTEVEEQDTILPLAMGTETSIRYAIRSTYWDGIDLVAAAPVLFGAEFALPARQTQEPGFEFWRVLDLGIDDVRSEYDVIIIDTPPALSYTTINAFMASNGIIMPLPPNALDFASASQFWSLFSDLTGELLTKRGLDKHFDFIHVLLARVDSADAASTVIRQWIGQTYAEKVLPVEIPKTAVTGVASAEFGTVYDVSRYDGSARTFKRARDAYDSFVGQIEGSIRAVWNGQVGALNGSTPVQASTKETRR